MKFFLSISFLFLIHFIRAQSPENKSVLELSEIMKGDAFIGHQPDNVRWSLDGTAILFDWNPHNQHGNSSYLYTLKSKEIDSLTPKFYETGSTFDGGEMRDVEVYSHQGNLYRFDRKLGKTTLILNNDKRISNVQRIPNMNCAFFQQDNALFAYDMDAGTIKQLVSFSKEGKKKSDESNYMSEQELELFQFLKDEKEKKEWNEAQSSAWESSVKEIFYSQSGVSNIQIDGTGKYITFRLDENPTNTDTHVEHHISKDGHTYTSNARSKVSDVDPNHKLGIYDMKNDTVYYVDFSSLPDIRKKPAYLQEYGDENPSYGSDRNIVMHTMIYSPDGKSNVMDIRSYDNKDRWIVSVDLSKGTISVLDHQHDEAWIGEPGISSWNMASGIVGWMDNSTVYFQSEESGFSHLYSQSVSSSAKMQLTKGNWEVHDVRISSKRDRFYITANKVHPGNREFYHYVIASGELIPILTADGNHEIAISPDEKSLAVRYSTKTSPWELYFAPNKKGATLTRITESTSEEFKQYSWHDPKVITIPTSDGKPVYARIYSPEESTKNGAAVIFVHGAGYLQNAHNYWSGYYREYMFHNMLRDNGYTVLDIDFRASEGYGRDHRTAIYRHMGGTDLSDHLDGRQFLIDSMGVDPNRVGIYGGSYGGFITLMALLTSPGKFKCGGAIRSVTDWFHYNHEYTSNILNYPSSDPKAYEKSSPIYYADKLEDRLLMLHGMVDDNVQFQDVVRISQRFIELGKKNWEMAIYPVEAHAFQKSYSWTDEYRRIFEMFQEELLTK